jgi:hypothetical protein
MNCKYFDEKNDGCKINKGIGWKNEYCKIVYSSETCDNKEKNETLRSAQK